MTKRSDDRWTDKAIDVAKKYNDLQFSRAQIARMIYDETGLVFTRNAVIGKLARLGVACTRPKQAPSTASRRPRRVSTSAAVIRSKGRIIDAGIGKQPLFVGTAANGGYALAKTARTYRREAVEHIGAPVSMNVPFGERVDPQCAFICSADGEPATVCGHKQMNIFRPLRNGTTQVEKSSYCPFHHGLTHQGYGSYAGSHQEEVA
jgi:hypothetical protein